MSDHGFYEPTEHHLLRLRELGRGPHSGAARGAAILAVACLAAWVVVVRLPSFLSAGLALARVSSPALAAQLMLRIARTGCLIAVSAVGLLLAMAMAAWAVDALLAGVARERRSLISRTAFRLGAVRAWFAALLCEIVALALGWVWLWRVIGANQADPPRFVAAFSSSAAGAIAVIVLGIAALDAVLARAVFFSSARMTREQFLQHQKETRPPVIVTLRRTARMRARR